MNRIITCILSILSFALILSACKKDKDTNATFTGTWEMSSVQVITTVDGELRDSSTEASAPGDLLFTFNNDNTFAISSETDKSLSNQGWYSLDGNKFTMTLIDNADTVANIATYSINGKTMTLTFTGEEIVTGSVYKNEEIWKLSKR